MDGVERDTDTGVALRSWFTYAFQRVKWLKFADGNELRIGDVTSFVIGGAGDDVLIGTQGNDFLYGGVAMTPVYRPRRILCNASARSKGICREKHPFPAQLALQQWAAG